MRGRLFAVVVMAAMAAAWLAPSGGAEPRSTLPPLVVDKAAPRLDGPPALKVDKSAPLLLDDAPSQAAAMSPAGVRLVCYDCHANYLEEPLAVWHAKEKITCRSCHGESEAHANDEDNVTPPDVIYPLAAIDAKCRECHDAHDAPAVEVIKRWQKRCPQKTNPSDIACTDCHGEHRLKVRTVRWDKRTKELLDAAAAKP